jgi:hypothetical protein
LTQKASKNVVHKQQEIIENLMGWSFFCHFSAVGESFHSHFLLKNAFSRAARNKKTIHKQHKITSLLINDNHLNIHIIEQHSIQLYIELYFDLVFSVGIRLVFLGIYRTDTGGNLGQYFGIIFLAGTPFFLERGVFAPFLRGQAPIFRKKGFPAKP